MRTLLRAALGCTVMAGAFLAAAPAHAATVCYTAPNGAPVCFDNGAGGQAPGTGTVGGSGPYVAPPAPAAPAPAAPAPAPRYVAPAPVQAPAPVYAPAPQAPYIPVWQAPAAAPAGPANTGVPVTGNGGAAPAVEAPAAVPAEVPAAPAEAPAAVPAAATSSGAPEPTPLASATASVPAPPSATPTPELTVNHAGSTERRDPLPYALGGVAIAGIILAGIAWLRRRRITAAVIPGAISTSPTDEPSEAAATNVQGGTGSGRPLGTEGR